MAQARSEWIVRIDSDERLSPELQREIRELLRTGPACDVYDAPFTSYFLGHPVRYGSAWEQPTRKTLFRKGTLVYRVESEHEDLTPVGGRSLTYGVLRERYHHFSCPDISTYLRKLDYYSERDFERVDADRVRVLAPWRLMVAVARYFVHQYVGGRGFRDGYAGFALCALNAVYRLVHELKAWEFASRGREHHVRAREHMDEVLGSHSVDAP